ncbi:MAG: 5'-methylthioadenosine phosphorylase [Burkholderiales bacterium]|jgi:5'-methylthioadenosine phosphorylase|nr:hypothetical protein [Novosphingobium sp.]
MLLGFWAVGSLALEVAPGMPAMPEQCADWTRGGRERSFFGGGVAAHVSMARPVSGALVAAVEAAAQRVGARLARGLTYACVEGPRLSTQAESQLLRQLGCHLVGVTNVPEVLLAREARMAYAAVGLVTDYDSWLDDPARHVSVGAIFERCGRTLSLAREVLDESLRAPLPEPEPDSRQALDSAVLTPDAALSAEQTTWLSVLRA